MDNNAIYLIPLLLNPKTLSCTMLLYNMLPYNMLRQYTHDFTLSGYTAAARSDCIPPRDDPTDACTYANHSYQLVFDYNRSL